MPERCDPATQAAIARIFATSKQVLYLRLDGIGDAVLANSALERLAAAMPDAGITVACDSLAAPLYEASPLVSRTIALNRWALHDDTYRNGASKLLSTLRPDAVLSTTHSSPRAHCLLALSLGVPVIALENNLANMGPEDKDFFEQRVHCIPSPDPDLNELERYADMLERIGLSGEGLEPTLWLTDEDRAKAAATWRESGFSPDKTIAVFGAGSAFIRAYLGFGQALREICKTRGFSVVALGAAQDASVNAHLLAPLHDAGVPAVDFAGRLSLRESSALLADCALAVGVETSLAHIAGALNVPQVIVLGGGHFGRFMPVHKTTTAVVLPLDCFACNWSCPHAKPYCIRSILPETVAQAVEYALTEHKAEPRRTLFMQKPRAWRPQPGMPAWKSPAHYIEINRSRTVAPLHVATSK